MAMGEVVTGDCNNLGGRLMDYTVIAWFAFGLQVVVLLWGVIGLLLDQEYKVPPVPDWEARADQRMSGLVSESR